MKHWFSMLRPFNGVMAIVAVWLGYALATKTIALPVDVILACASAFLILSAGMVANDFFDRHIDKKNKPHRPIPSGKIPAKHALLVSIALFIVGIGLAGLVNNLVLGIAIIASALLYTYAETTSKKKFIGNAVVAASTGLTFIFGEAVTGTVGSPVVILLALVAFYSTWAREIYKDIEDMKADKGHRETLPLKEGIVPSAAIAGIMLVVAVAITPVPFFLGIMGFSYLILIGLVDACFLGIAFSAVFQRKERKFHTYASMIKFLQAVALLGFATSII